MKPFIEPILYSFVTAGLFGDVLTTIIALSVPGLIEDVRFSRWLMNNNLWGPVHVSLWIIFVPGLPILKIYISDIFLYAPIIFLGLWRLNITIHNVRVIQGRVREI